MSTRATGLLSAILAVSACAEPARGPFAASSSIVLDPAGATVWVVSPDDDAVVALAADSLQLRQRASVAGAPGALAWGSVGGLTTLVVALQRSPELALIDPGDGSVRRRPIPCAGASAVVAVGAEVFLACPHDDRVLRLDLDADAAPAVLEVPGRPVGLARAEGRLAVSLARTGVVSIFSVDTIRRLAPGERHAADALAPEALPLESSTGFAASGLDALAVDPLGRGFTAAFSRVDRDSDRARPAEQGGYGAVVDERPRIEPRLGLFCGGRYARFDGGPRAMSGPAALAFRGRELLVAHRFTDDVALLECGATEREALRPLAAKFRVGRGPRGLAISADGKTAFVDVAFDHAVARLDLPAPGARAAEPLEPALVERYPLGPTALSERALIGRKLFFDAVNVRLTPSGVVTCGTCHPEGGEDGLVWFLHTREVPRKLRRTPPAWAGRPSLAPYHWDGEFESAATLSARTIVALMEGNGLLVDTDAIARYLEELPPPPPRPPEGDEASLRARGASVFLEAGCADCHPPPTFADGAAHAVLRPSADPDAELADAGTPSLLAVRTRPPYLHDGRATTLRAVLTEHNPDDRHGRTRALDDAALDALVAYLESL
jgi:mono/diheme cytochrome c family protein